MPAPTSATPALSSYRAKRDFTKTQEPSGERAVVASPRGRFVIQKHDATRLHYDLRLELDGVFKSWAVTRGPSLNPQDKRLAVETEDHPLDYGDFEGTIPKGQYGGGTVQLWDRGFWEPDGPSTPEKGLASGDFKFKLHGERLHGSWVLVRMKHDRAGGKRTNWLLIKHRDEHERDAEAVETMMAEDRSVASGRTMAAIAAGKGRAPKPFMLADGSAPKADAVWTSNRDAAAPSVSNEAPPHPAKQPAKAKGGTIAKTAAKATAKTRGAAAAQAVTPIPAFVEPQLCSNVPRPPDGAGWVHEVKFDGYRLQLRVVGGAATLKTRKGLDWTSRFAAVADVAAGLPDCLVDGEVVALDDTGAPDFASLQAALSEGQTQNLIFYAFDLLHDGRRDMREEPLSRRKERLAALLADHTDPQGYAAPRRAFRHGRRCDPTIRMPVVARRYRVEAPRCPVRVRPWRELDQGEVPRRPRGGDRCLGDHGRAFSLASGRRQAWRPLRLYRPGRHRIRRRQGREASTAAESGRHGQVALLRARLAAQVRRHPLGPARARRGDRVRGLDGGRHGASSGVQGPARG